MFRSTESDPLVSTMNQSEIIYSPIDEHSRKIQQRRRWVKLGGATLAAGAVVVLAITLVHPLSSPAAAGVPLEVQADRLFAGLLADDEAFYFPTAASRPESRRFLRALTSEAPNTVSWSYDWQSNAKDGAAIGEYYRAKGLALADYYRSKYDPTYKAATDAEAAPTDDAKSGAASGPPDDASAWTYDWQADKDRGIALGEKYKAIGLAINAHYREAFDPTFAAPSPHGGRMLKSKEQKKKQQKDFPAASYYDWQADRSRGMAIGEHYKEMGDAIADHYRQKFDPTYGTNKKTYSDEDWANMWRDYKTKGQEIAKYYKSKGAAIEQFYSGKYGLEGMAAPVDGDSEEAEMAAAAPDVVAADGAKNEADVDGPAKQADEAPEAYIWGLDWQQDRQHAVALHKEMMQKGLAIGEYYRAKYDPSYDASSAGAPIAGDASSDGGKADRAAAGAADVAHHPDLDFPPWGQDADADREHGVALGEYWKKQGKATGKMYEKRGKDLGRYYEDLYRGKFDPTYNADTDMNW